MPHGQLSVQDLIARPRNWQEKENTENMDSRCEKSRTVEENRVSWPPELGLGGTRAADVTIGMFIQELFFARSGGIRIDEKYAVEDGNSVEWTKVEGNRGELEILWR